MNVIPFPLTKKDLLEHLPVEQANFLKECRETLSEEDFQELLEALNNYDLYLQSEKDIQDLCHAFTELM